MKLLVTGASSFLGRSLLKALPRDWSVTAVYCNSADFPEFLRKSDLGQVTPVRCDLTRPEEVRAMFQTIGGGFDACLYMAANPILGTSVQEPLKDLLQNAGAMANFLQGYRGGPLIYTSSGAVYLGHTGMSKESWVLQPPLPFSITKLAAEHYVRYFHAKVRNLPSYIILRFFGAYGPGDKPIKVYSKLVEHYTKPDPGPFTIRGDGRNYIDAMYIDDAVDGLLKVLRDPGTSSMTCDFCQGRPVSIRGLVETAARVFGHKARIVYEGETDEDIRFKGDPRPMAKRFGFRARVTLEEGFRKMAAARGAA